VGDQGLLRGPVQSLFHHVDDHDGRSLRFQSDEQGNQGVRGRRTVFNEPGQGVVDPGPECRVGVQLRPGCRAAVLQSIEAQEGRVRQSFGEMLGQSRFAAAQRADNVIQRPHVGEFEPFAAPRPGKIEGDAESGGRFQQARQFASCRGLALRDTAPKLADLLNRAGQRADPPFECRLMRGQGRLQALRIISEHPRDLGQAQSKCAQGDDLGGPGHLVGTVGPPTRRGAAGGYQAVLLIEPQRLCGDAEPLRGRGGVEESGGRAHESPRCLLTAILIEAVPGAGSSERSRPADAGGAAWESGERREAEVSLTSLQGTSADSELRLVPAGRLEEPV
jgi:hypothetical protein